jgi:hypothetical protein
LNFSQFDPGVAMVVSLFHFHSFSGDFNSSQIQVSGLDRNRLDFSQLTLNGQLIINAAPVPLPSAFWLMAGGLAAMGYRKQARG